MLPQKTDHLLCSMRRFWSITIAPAPTRRSGHLSRAFGARYAIHSAWLSTERRAPPVPLTERDCRRTPQTSIDHST
jgi:hypothetical protein